MDDSVYDALTIGGGADPAHVVCETRDDGRIIVCFVWFVGRRFAATEMGIMHGQHWFRSCDRQAMTRRTWGRFWRYLGAA